jgi:hypothetical protein
MHAGELVNLFVIERDGRQDLFQQRSPCPDRRAARGEDRRIQVCRNGLSNLLHALRDPLAVAAVVIEEETFDGGRLGALQLLQTGPAL